MDFVSYRLFRRTFRRRCVSAMLAAMYLVTAAGIPLPAGNVAHTSGESYPCSHSSCGCASAEKCWRSCCCHSLAERMAWAREHNVRPPEFAIAEARRAGVDLAWLEDATLCGSAPDLNGGRSTNCAAAEKPRAKLGAAGLFAMPGVRCCCAKSHEPKTDRRTSNCVIGWNALHCKGHSANWLGAVPTLVSAGSVQSGTPLIEWLGPLISDKSGRIG